MGSQAPNDLAEGEGGLQDRLTSGELGRRLVSGVQNRRPTAGGPAGIGRGGGLQVWLTGVQATESLWC